MQDKELPVLNICGKFVSVINKGGFTWACVEGPRRLTAGAVACFSNNHDEKPQNVPTW